MAQQFLAMTLKASPLANLLLARGADGVWADYDPQPPWSPTYLNEATGSWGAVWGAPDSKTILCTRSHLEGVYHYDGTNWGLETLPDIGTAPSMSAATSIGKLAGDGATRIWLAAGNGLWYWDGATWARDLQWHTEAPSSVVIKDIWVSNSGTLWITNSISGSFDPHEIRSRDSGGVWTNHTADIAALNPGANYGYGVHGTSDSDVWCGGGLDASGGSGGKGMLAHWNGLTWTLATNFGSGFGQMMYKLWTNTTNFVMGHKSTAYAVAWNGSVPGGSRTDYALDISGSARDAANDIFGIANDDIVIAGTWSPTGASIWHWDGAAWTKQTTLDQIYDWYQLGAVLVPQLLTNGSFEIQGTTKGSADAWTAVRTTRNGIGRFGG